MSYPKNWASPMTTFAFCWFSYVIPEERSVRSLLNSFDTLQISTSGGSKGQAQHAQHAQHDTSHGIQQSMGILQYFLKKKLPICFNHCPKVSSNFH